MITRGSCIVLLAALLSTVCLAGDKSDSKAKELTDPLEILKKADAAAKAVKTIQYEIAIATEGLPPEHTFEGTGKYVLSGFKDHMPEKSQMDVTLIMGADKKKIHVTGGADGDNFYVVDHANKKAYEDIDPMVMGSFGRYLNVGIMIEFLVEQPFGDEIRGKVKELRDSKVINGVDCYAVFVEYAQERAPSALWYFSKKDFLPRGRVDHYTTQDGTKFKRSKMLAKVKVAEKLKDDVFKLGKLPEGYTKTDDFAP